MHATEKYENNSNLTQYAKGRQVFTCLSLTNLKNISVTVKFFFLFKKDLW